MIKLKSNVQTGFTPRTYQSVDVNPNAYDTGGARLNGMAKALSSVSETADRIGQGLERDEVKKAVIALDKAARLNSVGRLPSDDADNEPQITGYAQLKGQAAIDAYPERVKYLEQQRTKIRDALPTGRAQRLFDNATETTFTSSRNFLDRHYAGEQQGLSAQVATAAMAETQANYISFIGNDIGRFALNGFGKLSPEEVNSDETSPSMTSQLLQAGAAEAHHQAQLNPSLGIASKENAALWTSDTHSKAASFLLAAGKVQDAENYIQVHKKAITPEDWKTLEPQLTLAVDQDKAHAFVTPLVASFNKGERQSEQTTQNAQNATPQEKSPVLKVSMQQEDYYGIPTYKTAQSDFNAAADVQGLTGSVREIAWDSYQTSYGQSLKKARQVHQDNLLRGQNLIDQGQTVSSLPIALKKSLSPRGHQSLQRYQEISQGLRQPETNWETLSHLGTLTSTALTKRVLVEDLPFLSPISATIYSSVQQMLLSPDPQQTSKGQAYLTALNVVMDGARSSGPQERTSDALDAMQIRALKMVDKRIQEDGAITRGQIETLLAPQLIDDAKLRLSSQGVRTPLAAENILAMTSRGAGIPVDMVVPVFDSLRRMPKADLTLKGMRRHYDEQSPSIIAALTGASLEQVRAIEAETKATGRQLSLGGVTRTLALLPFEDPYAVG